MSPTKILIGSLSVFICAAAAMPAAAQTSLYLRGDLGWAGATNANIHDRNFPLDHAITGPNGAAGTLSDIGSGWLIGGGVGFQWFPNLRGDIVYTYRGDYHLDQVTTTIRDTFQVGHSRACSDGECLLGLSDRR
jgi:opacity protein-like surface antigen